MRLRILLILILIFIYTAPFAGETSHTLFHMDLVIHDGQRITNEQMLEWDDFWGSMKEQVPSLVSCPRPSIHFVEKSGFKGKVNGMEKEFVSGFAIPSENKIIILTPFTSPGFPLNGLTSLIKHELLHIAVYNAGGAEVPLWLNEGVAQFYSGQYPANPVYWTLILLKRYPSLAEISGREFYSHPRMNYPFSYDIISFLHRNFGEKKIWELVLLYRYPAQRNKVKKIFGITESDLFDRFLKELKSQINPPIIFTPEFLLMICALLVPVAYIIHRFRLKKWMERQEADE